jgi:hypothetical protein
MKFDHLTDMVDYYVNGSLVLSNNPGFSEGGGYVFFGGVDGNFNLVSLTVGTTGIPESSTWAMLVLGFAGLGFVGYRRTKSGVARAN